MKKENFFKKMWKAIAKIEKYPDMSAEGFGKAVTYISKLIAIIAIVVGLGTIYQANTTVKNAVNYLETEFPNFEYKEGILNVDSNEVIDIASENSILGYTIVDTNTEDEETINKYINQIEQSGSGIIVLKNKVILKNSTVAGTINYEYKEITEQLGLEQFNKQDVLNFATSSQIWNLYASIFFTIFVYAFIIYLITTLINAVLLSAFGYIATLLIKIKVRYVAIFNMSIYALTLSSILNLLYIIINIFSKFNMQYFQVMYVAVAAIYLIAAIFILKTDYIKKQAELSKIAEAQEIVRKEMQEENRKKEEKEKDNNNKENKEEKEKTEDEKKENNGGETQGSNA